MLKLRKVELLGFKSFCEKTPITFSGTGITCIVGPNGCGKSNVVDAISWVLGEQSHKMLRAERMSDCIFNGTAKRPPMGLSEVTLTLIDPELSEAVAKVMDPEPEISSDPTSDPFLQAADATSDVPPDGPRDDAGEDLAVADSPIALKTKKKRSDKLAVSMRPGEIVVCRRLYRSGQSEYLINGRVARLRDIQEVFMGMGLGPDSYAIIEQGRIGQILNSKPMDRRAIIEEAAGITMYKTKRRLAEAKLEASKINLSRVHDILVEVEKQLASLKRQASKARRYAEIREQMRDLLRSVLASKAEHLDIEAARLQTLLRDMEAAEERESRTVHEMEAEQERLSSRTYELDGELRQTQNLVAQTALDLDRAENRITFNREQLAQIDSRVIRLTMEVEQIALQASSLTGRIATQRETISVLRGQMSALEAGLRESTDELSASAAGQSTLENRIVELRQAANRLVEESARSHAESEQADAAASRHSAAQEQRLAALLAREQECSALQASVDNSETLFQQSHEQAQQAGANVRQAQGLLTELRPMQQETSQKLEQTRQDLAAERARRASIEQILRERAYTADAIQKLFNTAGDGHTHDFRAIGLLADYAEVQEEYEGAIEQFLREELEYVVVESYDQARAGVALLRDDMGGRATFFVDSPRGLDADSVENGSSMPGDFIARLDRLVEFRAPLGSATKSFLKKLRTAYIVETAVVAERMAYDNPHSYFLTPDGTCYHGRMVSGGRKGDAGPLALKRELRQHDAETTRLERLVAEHQTELTRLESEIAMAEANLSAVTAQQMEAEKSLVGFTHQRDQVRTEFLRMDQQLAAERREIAGLRAEVEGARERAERARQAYSHAQQSRTEVDAQTAESTATLAALRLNFQGLQEAVAARREELAMIAERLASSESIERRLAEEVAQETERLNSLRQQQVSLSSEKTELDASCLQLARQVEDLRTEHLRLQEQKAILDTEWNTARSRSGQIDETLRGRRQSLEELRSERSQRQIEKARNDADRDYLRQTCVSELNSQPEELMAQQPALLVGEDLIAAETNYNEMKARVEAMGPVNMMALEEFKECEARDEFLRRERDDLVQSIQNTQLTITELDQVSRQKFEEAFNFINAHFSIAFQSLFGGGAGEMRLTEADSSGDAGIDIVAQPPGKRLQNILLLSGGEKALTALALLIAVFRYQPSPFCILDEVDAPLDEANVGRFNKMLAEMCGETQFIVVTHNRRTMEMGSVLYGVTMQEPGVSKLVSVKWEEDAAANAPRAAAAAASNAA